MKTIITTVGTSIISNYFDKEKNKNIDITITTHYEKLKNKPYSEWDSYKTRVDKLKPVVSSWAKDNKNVSAEIKSLLAIQKKVNNNLEVYLLTTDTILSNVAAKIIKGYFGGSFNISIKEIKIIDDLQVRDFEKFEKEGLINLTEKIYKIIQEKCIKDIILNITGGYKAIIPYMTIIGQVNNIAIYYIFEDTDELIKIPQVPVDFDFSLIEDNYIAFETIKPEKKEENLPLKEKFIEDLGTDGKKEYEKLERKKLIKLINDKVKLDIIGSIMFERYEKLISNKEYNKQNIISNLIELKIFEYYVGECQNAKVIQGKKIGNKDYDIDIYIENEQKIEAIEVKPAGNVPFEEIEKKLKEGGFHTILQKNKSTSKKIKLKIFLYTHKEDIHEKVSEKIRELNDKIELTDKTKHLEWIRVKLKENYKSAGNWKINSDSFKKIYPK